MSSTSAANVAEAEVQLGKSEIRLFIQLWAGAGALCILLAFLAGRPSFWSLSLILIIIALATGISLFYREVSYKELLKRRFSEAGYRQVHLNGGHFRGFAYGNIAVSGRIERAHTDALFTRRYRLTYDRYGQHIRSI